MLDDLKTGKYRRVGIVGVPPLAIIKVLHDQGLEVYDLDGMLVKADMSDVDPYLPRVYCAILRTVMINALHLPLDCIVIDIGPGKCDSAMHVASVMEDVLHIPVIRTRNEDMTDFGTPICQSNLPLEEKIGRIVEAVQLPHAFPRDSVRCRATAGFWGVPPRDFGILAIFPDTTHVFGWTRCMENKTPANLELESFSDIRVPTVFFAQSFCAKNALAYHLARRHPQALYLDVDLQAGSSARAKVEAFLELSGAYAC